MSKFEDDAQLIEMAARNAAISYQRKQNPKVTLSHCEDCGDKIPKERRAIKGITRCIDCQEYYEKQKKRGLL